MHLDWKLFYIYSIQNTFCAWVKLRSEPAISPCISRIWSPIARQDKGILRKDTSSCVYLGVNSSHVTGVGVLFLACIFSSRYNVDTCCSGVRSVAVVPVIGQFLWSHVRGRCLLSRYTLGAFYRGIRSVTVIPSARSVPVIPVSGRCLLLRVCPGMRSMHFAQSARSVPVGLVLGWCHLSRY